VRTFVLLSCLFLLAASTGTQGRQAPAEVPYRPGPNDAITDVPGVRVGHYTHTEGTMRGVTVVIPGKAGGTCGVDVRGSNPGTLATSTYDPINIGEECDAIVLTGGSLWGFATVLGVMEYLFEQGMGVRTRGGILPVVPAAVIFDLPVGDPNIRPQKDWGYLAARRAADGPVPQGNVGAGTGGTTGKLPGGIRLKGGLGTASAVLPDATVVGVLVVLNAVGDLVNPRTGEFLAVSGFDDLPYRHHYVPQRGPDKKAPMIGENTTLAVVATNARLHKVQLAKIAELAQDGLARAMRPSHTMWDGDTVFAVSVGWDDRVDPDAEFPAEATDRVGSVAADLLVRAILKGMQAADSIPGWPSYREWKASHKK
jgi:L-aminopeptidase/D-esterase-like protein